MWLCVETGTAWFIVVVGRVGMGSFAARASRPQWDRVEELPDFNIGADDLTLSTSAQPTKNVSVDRFLDDGDSAVAARLWDETQTWIGTIG